MSLSGHAAPDWLGEGLCGMTRKDRMMKNIAFVGLIGKIKTGIILLNVYLIVRLVMTLRWCWMV
jgi:hypothetical protein